MAMILVTTTVQADDIQHNDRGIFVQALTGTNTYDDGDDKYDSSPFALRFGYKFNKGLALEVTEIFHGEGDENFTDGNCDIDCLKIKASIDAQTTQVGVKLMLPLGKAGNHSLLFRSGLAFSIVNLKADITAEDSRYYYNYGSVNDDGVGIGNYIGAGYQFNHSEGFLFTAEYNLQSVRYDEFDDLEDEFKIKAGGLLLGFGYQF